MNPSVGIFVLFVGDTSGLLACPSASLDVNDFATPTAIAYPAPGDESGGSNDIKWWNLRVIWVFIKIVNYMTNCLVPSLSVPLATNWYWNWRPPPPPDQHLRRKKRKKRARCPLQCWLFPSLAPRPYSPEPHSRLWILPEPRPHIGGLSGWSPPYRWVVRLKSGCQAEAFWSSLEEMVMASTIFFPIQLKWKWVEVVLLSLHHFVLIYTIFSPPSL